MRIVYFLLISAFLIASPDASGQTYKKFMKQGNKNYRAGSYEKAINFYKKALKLKNGNVKATYMLGLSYLYSDDELPALEHIRKVYFLDPKIDKHIEYQLGLAYTYHLRFDEAMDVFQRYARRSASKRSDVEERIASCIMADSLVKHPQDVTIINLETINTAFNDYTPLVFDEGKSMVFTSNRPGSTGGLKLYDGTFYEDIYLVKKEGESWSDANKLGPSVNLKYHDAAGSISPDGKFLYLYYEHSGGNIYISKRNGDYFDEPTPLSEEINSVFWETSASITENGYTIYFASDRPGGFGGLDIYRSELGKDGKWLPAVNLGDKINTQWNEDSPYITPDGSRLYFGSSGHPGMGGEDIFYADIRDGKAGTPVNLGYPVNSVFNDNYFSLSQDQKEGYFASMRPGGKGMADIYHVYLTPQTENPIMASAVTTQNNAANTQPVEEEKAIAAHSDEELSERQEIKGVVAILRGKVIDENSGAPLEAEVRLVDNTSNKILASIQADPGTGDFELIIPHGGNYGVSTRKSGYMFNSLNFELPEFEENQEIDTHILMRRAEAGSKVILKNIFFDTGKSDLRTESLGELDRIKELLTDNPSLVVQINGHTDNVGNALANKILSKKRAESVVSYLIAQGVDPGRLSAKGFGEERPLVSNDDEMDGREINRRTEIEILKTQTSTQ